MWCCGSRKCCGIQVACKYFFSIESISYWASSWYFSTTFVFVSICYVELDKQNAFVSFNIGWLREVQDKMRTEESKDRNRLRKFSDHISSDFNLIDTLIRIIRVINDQGIKHIILTGKKVQVEKYEEMLNCILSLYRPYHSKQNFKQSLLLIATHRFSNCCFSILC